MTFRIVQAKGAPGYISKLGWRLAPDTDPVFEGDVEWQLFAVLADENNPALAFDLEYSAQEYINDRCYAPGHRPDDALLCYGFSDDYVVVQG